MMFDTFADRQIQVANVQCSFNVKCPKSDETYQLINKN